METFKILEGLPAHVSEDVNLLLSSGWALNGPLFTRIVDNQTIVGQCLTYNQSTTKNYIFSLQLTVSRQFDPAGILNLVYHKELQARGTKRYLMKIRAQSWESAEDMIQSELRIQISDSDYNIGGITHIDQALDYV